MPVRFIHFSDSHLGFIDYTSDDYTVQKAREEDAYKTVDLVIDHAIKTKPDFVLHTGDFFHRPSPYNKAIVRAASQFKRLSAAGIPFYMIAGNHDLPRLDDSHSIHPLYEMFDGCKVFYDQKYSVIDCGGYILHALPHINFDDDFRTEIGKIGVSDSSKPNILMMHLSMPHGFYKEEELGGGNFPAEKLGLLKEFDYVALGHWHRYNHLAKYGNVCYSGSTERINSGETDHAKGFVEVEINGKGTGIKFIELPTREYLIINVNNYSSKSKDEILNEISKAVAGRNLSEILVKVNFDNVPSERYYEIMRENVLEMTGAVLELKLLKKRVGEAIAFNASGNESVLDRLLGDLRSNITDDAVYSKFEALTKQLYEDILTNEGTNAN